MVDRACRYMKFGKCLVRDIIVDYKWFLMVWRTMCGMDRFSRDVFCYWLINSWWRRRWWG